MSTYLHRENQISEDIHHDIHLSLEELSHHQQNITARHTTTHLFQARLLSASADLPILRLSITEPTGDHLAWASNTHGIGQITEPDGAYGFKYYSIPCQQNVDTKLEGVYSIYAKFSLAALKPNLAVMTGNVLMYQRDTIFDVIPTPLLSKGHEVLVTQIEIKKQQTEEGIYYTVEKKQ